jgi:hypothetical protein
MSLAAPAVTAATATPNAVLRRMSDSFQSSCTTESTENTEKKGYFVSFFLFFAFFPPSSRLSLCSL